MNQVVENIFEKAKKTVQNNERLKNLLDKSVRKLNEISNNKTERDSFIGHLKTLVRMIQAHINGEYKAFSTKTILMFVFALVYFITPLDLIPDFIPVLGLTDDISIVYFIFRSFIEDIEAFNDWENSNYSQ